MIPSVRQLEYALALADHLHFGDAAKASAVSQPALSAQIQNLEELLGVELFERDTRDVRLTVAGELFVKRARPILNALRELADTVSAAAKPFSGEWKLGVIPTIAPYLLPKILPVLRQSYPDLRIVLREEKTEDLIEQLEDSKLDLLLLALPVVGSNEESLVLFEEEFALLMPSGHALAKKKCVKHGDLKGERILLLEEGHCLSGQALDYCEKRRVKAERSLSATSLNTLVEMVASGLGVTFLPKMAAERELRGRRQLELRYFSEPKPKRQIGLMWRKNSSRASQYKALKKTLDL